MSDRRRHHFKSIPLYYDVEQTGMKPNTVRIVDERDSRFGAVRGDLIIKVSIELVEQDDQPIVRLTTGGVVEQYPVLEVGDGSTIKSLVSDAIEKYVLDR